MKIKTEKFELEFDAKELKYLISIIVIVAGLFGGSGAWVGNVMGNEDGKLEAKEKTIKYYQPLINDLISELMLLGESVPYLDSTEIKHGALND